MEEKDDQDLWTLISAPADPFAGVKRILVLAPHPDDETLGCGGTVALYVSRGVEVYLAVISDGGKIAHEFAEENIDIVEARKKESMEASGVLGVKETYFLGFPDGELKSHEDEIAARIEEIILQCNPDIVFSPSPIDFHEDHIAVSKIALKLLMKPQGMKIAFYEVYGTIRFNSLVDISDVVDLKERAILCYRYSLFRTPEIFAGAAKALNRFRSFYTRENKYYEAFLIISRPTERGELLQWLTYGPEKESESSFLTKLKVVDDLFFEIRKYHDALMSHEAEIKELRVLIEGGQKRVDELQTNLDRMSESLAWRLATKFYRIRDRLLPEGSELRRMYERITSRLKSGGKGTI
jgi:LmbE family N-acetylglucosaminyl deacetylase